MSQAIATIPDINLCKLDELTYVLQQLYPLSSTSAPADLSHRECERQRLISALKTLLVKIVNGLTVKENFEIHVVRRSLWENVAFDPLTGMRLVPDPIMATISGPRLHRTAHVLFQLLRLLDSGDRATKRDHKYAIHPTFKSDQGQVDDIIDDIAATITISRLSLNTISSCEGLIFGDLRYRTEAGDEVYCAASEQPTTIMPDCTDIVQMKSAARFVLVVEKATVFQRLLEHSVPHDLNCILVTGKGYPDLPTRRMVSLLWQFLHIPVLALVDGDPHGIEIMCVYRFGSRTHAYDCSLSCPQMRWCGFLPSHFNLMRNHLCHMTATDFKKLDDLLKRPYIEQMPQLQDELKLMGSCGYKYGLERFAVIRNDYLSRNYLPECLSEGHFI